MRIKTSCSAGGVGTTMVSSKLKFLMRMWWRQCDELHVLRDPSRLASHRHCKYWSAAISTKDLQKELFLSLQTLIYRWFHVITSSTHLIFGERKICLFRTIRRTQRRLSWPLVEMTRCLEQHIVVTISSSLCKGYSTQSVNNRYSLRTRTNSRRMCTDCRARRVRCPRCKRCALK